MCRRSARHGTVSASGAGPACSYRPSREPCNSRAIVRAYGTLPNRYSRASGTRLRRDDEEAALTDGDRPRGGRVVQFPQAAGEPFNGEPGHGPADQPQVVDDRGDVGEPVQLLAGLGAVNREPGVAQLAFREREPARRLLGNGQAERVVEAVVCASVDLLAHERATRG